ncbi:hypothetical protein Tco_0698413 [Tanacetum coccineum]
MNRCLAVDVFCLLFGVAMHWADFQEMLLSTTKLLRHTGIVSPGPISDDALSVFNKSMETGLLGNPSEIAAPKLIKKMADIYFTRVTKNAESTFSLSPRQIALWTSQKEDHTSDWLRTVPISRLGQTMNGKTYRCVLCYRLGISLFSVSKPCSACLRVFAGDIYGDHVVSCAGIISIKHRHNVVCDTLVDICYRSGISAGKEVDIGLDERRDKPLRPADMLLYSWDRGLDVCVDLTGSSPLTQTGMVDFVPDRVVIDVAQRKRGEYMAKCAAIGYGFLPFSFLSLGELEADAVTLLKRIRKFFMAQDIGTRVDVHIFNRISFAIANGLMNNQEYYHTQDYSMGQGSAHGSAPVDDDDSPVKEMSPVKAKKPSKRASKAKKNDSKEKEAPKDWIKAKEIALCQA